MGFCGVRIILYLFSTPPPPTPARVGTFVFWKCCIEILNFFPNTFSPWALVAGETGKMLGLSNLQAPSSLPLASTLLREQERPETG